MFEHHLNEKLDKEQALNFSICRARPLFYRAHSYITAQIGKIGKGTTNLQGQWEGHWGQSKGHPRQWPWINLSPEKPGSCSRRMQDVLLVVHVQYMVGKLFVKWPLPTSFFTGIQCCLHVVYTPLLPDDDCQNGVYFYVSCKFLKVWTGFKTQTNRFSRWLKSSVEYVINRFEHLL